MAVKTIDESPTLIDTIKFVLKTPTSGYSGYSGYSGDGSCLYANPYKVSTVKIYFIARDFVSGNFREYEQAHYDQVKLQAALDAEQYACDYPTPENIQTAQDLRSQAELSATRTTFYYNEAVAVKQFGDDINPAWIGTIDPENCPLVNVSTGVFELEWEPKGMREGQYFICWTWEPLPAGDSLTDHQYFEIFAATEITALPQHVTNPDKYKTLLERYTPSMFKLKISNVDLAPTVLDNFNKSVAKGFTVIEDYANQLIDLMDANVVNENFLPYLANMFNLQLKSQDPTLWRRQIKRAVPLFKKKGTYAGLQEAFAEAGFNLLSITRLWQIISRYTWVEGITAEVNGQTEFILDKNPILPIDPANFELYLRPVGILVGGVWTTNDFVPLTQDYVSFSTTDHVTTMTWLGATQPSPIVLAAGDTLKVVYQVREVPSPSEQTIEDYIRTLELADQRDDRDQEYPKKNWNVRIIEEDDPYFDIVVPTRHPFENPVIFGQVRTEFPLSENLYNMDEYDGSLRESDSPCDIDKDFLDCCTACMSSKFNVNLEISDISDDRLHEAYQILEEYKPFHAILHSFNFSALVEEYVNCNVEDIEALVTVELEETVLADTGNVFTRVMQHSLPGDDSAVIRRNMLNDMTNETGAGVSGTISSSEIVLYAPDVDLLHLNINNWNYLQTPTTYVAGTNQNVMEILAPHANAGDYVLSGDISLHLARVDSAPDPFDSSGFTYRISNFIYNNAINQIDPYDATTGIVTITDGTIDDVRNLFKIGDYIRIGADPLTSQHKLVGYVDGETHKFYIEYTGASVAGSIDVYRRLVDNQVGYMNYRGIKLVLAGNYETSLGILNGASAPNYPFLDGFLNQGSGRLDGGGIPSDTDDDHFKENFMVRLDVLSTTYYFLIEDIHGNYPLGFTTFILSGLNQSWPTTGTPATVSIYRATKKTFSVPEQHYLKEVRVIRTQQEEVSSTPLDETNSEYIQTTGTRPPFDYETPAGGGPPTDGLDRRGKDLVSITQEVVMPMALRTSVLNALNNGNQVVETINQQESITFSIEWAEGSEGKK